MAIEWTTDLATGIDEVDDQHKELFKRFDNLLTACNQGKGRQEVLNLLLFLDDYIKLHFESEERLQQKHQFPGYSHHREEHRKFVRDTASLEEEYQKEGATISLVIQTNKMLVSWLINHIKKMDKEFAGFLQENSKGSMPAAERRL